MHTLKRMTFLFLFVLFCSGCMQKDKARMELEENSSGYGVFLSVPGEEIEVRSAGCQTVVVDAQYVSKETIHRMRQRGQTVYTYLNIGSMETFRPYFNEYEELIQKPYENWEEEYWVDVTDRKWHTFTKALSLKLLEKGVDGFWVDNVDVYSHFPNPDTYRALETILKDLIKTDKEVILNSGNEFVEDYFQQNKEVASILTGVNQETVFSSINFETGTFGRQSSSETAYFLEYLEQLDALGKDVYLLEYTTDPALKEQIRKFAKQKQWDYDISESIELDGISQ